MLSDCLHYILPLLALAAFSLQIAGFTGCDIVRIHFKALNDNGIYFNNDPWVGLGYLKHQVFTDKNTRFWNHDSTCTRYSDLENNMFMEGNLYSSKALSGCSLIATAVLTVIVTVRFVSLLRGYTMKKRAMEAIFYLAVVVLAIVSATLQGIALDMIHMEDGICDRDSYFPTTWNELFPFQIYPDYSYFKFFNKCSLGPDARRVTASIVIHGFMAFFAVTATSIILIKMSKDTGDSSEPHDKLSPLRRGKAAEASPRIDEDIGKEEKDAISDASTDSDSDEDADMV